MALSNYAELVESISAWLDGSDLGGREADLIALCEDEINARLAALTAPAATVATNSGAYGFRQAAAKASSPGSSQPTPP